jgi:hypothetical protein
MGESKSKRQRWAKGVEIEDQDFAHWLMDRTKRLFINDDKSRSLIVSEFGGAFGLAGYVVSLNGTPPQSTLMIHLTHQMLVVTTFDSDSYKVYSALKHEALWKRALAFLDRHKFEMTRP